MKITSSSMVSELLYWSYANLAMAEKAVHDREQKYSRLHFMIRARLLSGLTKRTMSPRSLMGMNRGDRLQSDRGHGLHIDWGVCPGKMSYQWNKNNDLLIWRKADGLR